MTLTQQQQENRETVIASPDYQRIHLSMIDTLTASTWKAAQEEMLERVRELLKDQTWGKRSATYRPDREPTRVEYISRDDCLAALEELSERKVC